MLPLASTARMESGARASRLRDEFGEFPDVVRHPVGKSFVPSLMPSRLPFGSTAVGRLSIHTSQ